MLTLSLISRNQRCSSRLSNGRQSKVTKRPPRMSPGIRPRPQVQVWHMFVLSSGTVLNCRGVEGTMGNP
eukprot:1425200-Amphidinium_carterae.1